MAIETTTVEHVWMGDRYIDLDLVPTETKRFMITRRLEEQKRLGTEINALIRNLSKNGISRQS